jgi:hypothetical protein
MPTTSLLEVLQRIERNIEADPKSCSAEPDLRKLNANLLDCTSDPDHERVVIRYTKGTGRLSPDRKYITLDMKMYKLDRSRGGWHQGVWKALFQRASELAEVPAPPVEPLDEPVGPVADLDPLAQTKAIWDFGRGNAVFAVGPALSHLVVLANRWANFSVACSQIITNGTGLFHGVHGLKQSLGATRLPPGAENVMFDPTKDVPPFEATTIDTFRIVWPGGVPKELPDDY